MKLLNLTNRFIIFVIALFLLLISVSFLTYRVIYLMDREISDHMRYEKCRLKNKLFYSREYRICILSLVIAYKLTPFLNLPRLKVILRDTTVLLSEGGKILKVPIAFCPMNGWFQTRVTGLHCGGDSPKTVTLETDSSPQSFLLHLDYHRLFYFLNRWFPVKYGVHFTGAINVLKKFDLQKRRTCLFQRSNVEEFNTLNAELPNWQIKLHNATTATSRVYGEHVAWDSDSRHHSIKLEIVAAIGKILPKIRSIIRSTLDSVNRLSKWIRVIFYAHRERTICDEDLVPMGQLVKKQLESLDVYWIKTIAGEYAYRWRHEREDESASRGNSSHQSFFSNAIKYCTRGGELNIMLWPHKGWWFPPSVHRSPFRATQIFFIDSRGFTGFGRTWFGDRTKDRRIAICNCRHDYINGALFLCRIPTWKSCSKNSLMALDGPTRWKGWKWTSTWKCCKISRFSSLFPG